jgi:P-type Ca2+ transporter type 2C
MQDETSVFSVRLLIVAMTGTFLIYSSSIDYNVVLLNTGLPLTITLASALTMIQMITGNLLICTLSSCRIMGNASVLCTDKTGTLTQNEMTVVAGSIGTRAKFFRSLGENWEQGSGEERNARNFAVNLSHLDSSLPPKLVELFNASIAVNSTAFESVDPKSGTSVFLGNKTETALLKFAKELGWPSYKTTRDAASIIRIIPFSSDRKSTGCVVRLPGGGHRLYIKGASEVLAHKSTRHVTVYRDAAKDNPSGEIETAPIEDVDRDNISHTISSYASQSLRTIALCYRDFSHWPPKGAEIMVGDLASDIFPSSSTRRLIHLGRLDTTI